MDIDMSNLRLLEQERDIPVETLISMIESALLHAYQKNPGAIDGARAEVDRTTGRVTILAPEVDEQFHLVLGQVLEGISELESSDAPRDGAVMIVEALNAYGEHFEHPGWQMIN